VSSEPSSIGNVWPNSATSPSPRSRRSIAVAVAEGTPCKRLESEQRTRWADAGND
jgi:hypothetical protein